MANTPARLPFTAASGWRVWPPGSSRTSSHVPTSRCRLLDSRPQHPRSIQSCFGVACINRRASHTQRRRTRLPLRRRCRQRARDLPPLAFAYEARTDPFCANDARPISCSRGGRCLPTRPRAALVRRSASPVRRCVQSYRLVVICTHTRPGLAGNDSHSWTL